MTLFPAYLDLEPAAVWEHFSALNHIPRPSGQEGKVREHIQSLALQHGASMETDARGNCCVRLAARGAADSAPMVTLQSHLDMVCQKRPDVIHDFDLDSIVPRREGDKVFATGTTLGADNGLGVALMLAVLSDETLVHGPLELLFTVEEETGLYGAALLDPKLVNGRLMINLDSEDPDEITIGCAGGATTTLRLPMTRGEISAGEIALKVGVSGLQGGHSGIEIGQKLANSLKILSQVLDAATQNCPNLRLISIDGGTAHNAIPREASALIALAANEIGPFDAAFERVRLEIEAAWRQHEPNLRLTRGNASPTAPLSKEISTPVLRLLRELPHGVVQMSESLAGKVQTSSNLAEVHTREAEIEFSVSNRSFLDAEIRALQLQIAQLGQETGASVEARDGYPGWEPRADSPLLEETKRAYRTAMGREAKIEVVHAGLECGLLSRALPGLDAVSFGPLIKGAHTPEEWVSISSVGEIYALLNGLLAELATS